MNNKMNMIKNKKENEESKGTKIALVIVAIVLFVALGFVVSGNPNKTNLSENVQNVEMRDGVQYVTIKAKGGYIPRMSNAKAGVPTKLLVDTKDTFDCSASLVINSLNYREMLPMNGQTEIDLGVPVAGEPLVGLCSMGMYSFTINFS